MPEEPIKESATGKRFVAFLDIMGFQDMVARNTHEEVKEKMNKLCDIKEKIDVTSRKKPLIAHWVKPILFSDSLLLVSSEDSFSSVREIIFCVQLLLSEAASMGIPMKGAIAYGIQTADFKKSLHFGQPLIDAYKLQDELLLYGVVLHHSMEEYLTKKEWMAKLEATNDLFRYETPLKEGGKIFHYIVDWIGFPRWSTVKRQEEDKKMFQRLYGSVSGSKRIYVDNTFLFAEWLEKERVRRWNNKTS